MWVISPNLRIKLRKGDLGRCLIYLVFHVREEERVERSSTFLYDLRSSVARFSSGQELKFIYAMRATHGPRTKIQAKSSGDRGFLVSGTSESFVFAQRGRDSSYFDLFSILGAVWLSFNALRGCLEK